MPVAVRCGKSLYLTSKQMCYIIRPSCDEGGRRREGGWREEGRGEEGGREGGGGREEGGREGGRREGRRREGGRREEGGRGCFTLYEDMRNFF